VSDGVTADEVPDTTGVGLYGWSVPSLTMHFSGGEVLTLNLLQDRDVEEMAERLRVPGPGRWVAVSRRRSVQTGQIAYVDLHLSTDD